MKIKRKSIRKFLFIVFLVILLRYNNYFFGISINCYDIQTVIPSQNYSCDVSK